MKTTQNEKGFCFESEIFESSSFKHECRFLLGGIPQMDEYPEIMTKRMGFLSSVNESGIIAAENSPKDDMLDIYYKYSQFSHIASLVAEVGECIYSRYENCGFVLVSFCGSGVPFGILLKKYLKEFYGIEIEHYSISITYDEGVDENAISYIQNAHPLQTMVFVDGWSGSGMVYKKLAESLEKYNEKYHTAILPHMAVLSDPAKLIELRGTDYDQFLPYSVLGAAGRGLVGEACYCEDSMTGYHTAVIHHKYEKYDKSMEFIDSVFKCFKEPAFRWNNRNLVITAVSTIENTETADIDTLHNKLKKLFPNIDVKRQVCLGTGETFRAIIYEKPVVLLIDSCCGFVREMRQIAAVRGIPVQEYDLHNRIGNFEYAAIIQDNGNKRTGI